MLFISHTWKRDEEGRNTHARVRLLVRHLRNRGIRVWFDEEMLKLGNIDTAMADGIDSCTHFVACLTKKYIYKVNYGVRENPMNDNCAKEFNYAMVRGKPIVPVIFENAALDPEQWPPGILSFYSNHVHLRAIHNDWPTYSNMIWDVTMIGVKRRTINARITIPKRLPPICHDNQQITPRQPVRFWCGLKKFLR